MTMLMEGNLQITFPRGVNARKFDDKSSHGLSHCMKAVDFMVELTDRVLFVEIKDPEHPLARREERKKFVEGFLAGNLDDDLKYKFRDSFLYEWACKKINKPINYLIIVAIDALTDADLLGRTDDLKRKLPVRGPSSGKWKRQMVVDCTVFNIRAWNQFLPDYPVSRIGP